MSPTLQTNQRAAIRPSQIGDLDESVHVADFKAAPAAVLKQKPFVPKASAAPVTVPHGFALATEQRGSMAEARLQEQLTREADEEEHAREFKATDLPKSHFSYVLDSSYYAPFIYSPFIHLYSHTYIYVHPLYMYIHNMHTSKHL